MSDYFSQYMKATEKAIKLEVALNNIVNVITEEQLRTLYEQGIPGTLELKSAQTFGETILKEVNEVK